MFDNLSRIIQFHSNIIKITGALHEYLSLFMLVSPSVLLKMRTISENICTENKTPTFFSKICLL